MPTAFISGCAGLELTANERALFRAMQPAGFILFARNRETPDQVARLTDQMRDAVGREVLILVDQEGGRVQRLDPPQWRALPPAAAYATLFERDPGAAVDAAEKISRLCAHDLKAVGINVNCVPVLDVPAPDGHEIIGSRAYGRDPQTIVALARAVANGHTRGGVAPVIKHLPGHGRATADSHLQLPRVNASAEDLARVDFAPFLALADLPAGMTAHVVYEALDPAECASTSAVVVEEIIRQKIGFDGLLMSDDLSMRALSGEMGARTRRVLGAGCDVALHCNGNMIEMKDVAANAPPLEGDALRRLQALEACAFSAGDALDIDEAEALRLQLIGLAG